MLHAVLNVTDYPFTLRVKDAKGEVLSTLTVVPQPNEDIDRTVSRTLRKAGFFTVGKAADHHKGGLYRLTSR